MSASEGDPDTPVRKFQGFQTYADDTPRGEAPDDAPLESRSWAEAPYGEADDDDGYEAFPAEDRAPIAPEIRREPRRAPPGALIALGVALAVGAGVYVAREDPAPPRETPPPPAAGPTVGPQMNVEVATATETPPPPASPSPSDRLEVLPPSMAGAARGEPSVLRTYPRAPLPSRTLEITPPRPDAAPAPPIPQSPRAFGGADVARDAVAIAPPRAQRPWSDCRDAPTLAVSMVCADRGLASLDQRMKQAYSAALDAGAPADLLREDQDDWLDVREEAAHVSRRAVADIYRQRIGELRRVALED